MKVLGLIPARGGSKGIPRKNVALLGGRPLIAWTIDAALAASCLDAVVVSTDDDEIAETATQLGAETLRRPRELAADDSGALDVLRHGLDVLDHGRQRFEAVAYLQPTSPLRGADRIAEAVRLLEERQADSVVTVVPVPHHYAPASLMTVEGSGWLRPVDPAHATGADRRDAPRLVARNGPAILVVRSAIVDSGLLYGPRTLPLVMSQLESVDIDTPQDLELAELLACGRAGAGDR